MLALETNDDWGWIVDVSVSTATETYTNSHRDIVSSMEAFVAWLNSPSREWYGFTTYAWSWTRNAHTSSATVGGALITLYRTSGTLTMSIASAGGGDPGTFPTTTGIAYFVTQSTVMGAASAAGSVEPTSGIGIRAYANLLGTGDAGGQNVVRNGVQGNANIKPKVTATGTVQDMTRLALVTAAASNPRRCYAWQRHTQSWLQFAMGNVSWMRIDVSFYSLTFDMSGGVM
jgi:hypothetical protein